MTPEVQRAMARYEDARYQYRRAVLASMTHSSDGQAIRQALRSFQDARAELRRLQAPRPKPPPLPRKPRPAPASAPAQGWCAFLKLLKAG